MVQSNGAGRHNMDTHFNPEEYRVTKHARDRLAQRGFTLAMLYTALQWPEKVYMSKKFDGQLRVVSGEMCIPIDPKTKTVITVFFDQRLDEENYKG
jgi:hypothetical protein